MPFSFAAYTYVLLYKAGKTFIKGTKAAAVALREYLPSNLPPLALAGANGGTTFAIAIPSAEAAAQAGAVAGAVPVVLTMVGVFLFIYSSFKNDWNRLQEDMNQAEEAGAKGTKELSGEWQEVNESMSDASRRYQTQITGEEGKAWVQNGVKNDGMKDGILIETKGHYEQFVDSKTGRFYDWFAGQESFVEQARSQIAASEGAPIQWYFAEESVLEATEQLFNRYNITGIELIFEAMK